MHGDLQSPRYVSTENQAITGHVFIRFLVSKLARNSCSIVGMLTEVCMVIIIIFFCFLSYTFSLSQLPRKDIRYGDKYDERHVYSSRVGAVMEKKWNTWVEKCVVIENYNLKRDLGEGEYEEIQT